FLATSLCHLFHVCYRAGDLRWVPSVFQYLRLWPIQPHHEVELVSWRWQPVWLLVFAWRLVLYKKHQRTIFFIFQSVSIADRESIQLIFHKGLLCVVHADRPESAYRWQLTGGETDLVSIRSAQRLAVGVRCCPRVNGILRQVSPQSDQGDKGP